MQLYRSKGGEDSGVSAYKIADESILVKFKNGSTYLYTYSSAGKTAIETMKKLATSNKGLSTYISQHQPVYQQKY